LCFYLGDLVSHNLQPHLTFLSGDEADQQFGVGDMSSFFGHFTIWWNDMMALVCQTSTPNNMMCVVFDMQMIFSLDDNARK